MDISCVEGLSKAEKQQESILPVWGVDTSFGVKSFPQSLFNLPDRGQFDWPSNSFLLQTFPSKLFPFLFFKLTGELEFYMVSPFSFFHSWEWSNLETGKVQDFIKIFINKILQRDSILPKYEKLFPGNHPYIMVCLSFFLMLVNLSGKNLYIRLCKFSTWLLSKTWFFKNRFSDSHIPVFTDTSN